MVYQKATTTFLSYLKANPGIRSQVRAAHDQTLLYAGEFFKPMWREIAEFKRQHPEYRSKETLPEVLARIKVPGAPQPNLLAYVQDVERTVPWKPDGFALWRVVSGLFASNATGAVSFQIGSGITKSDKVFAATEVSVLARNPNLDATTRELVAYYQECIKNKQTVINAGFISG